MKINHNITALRAYTSLTTMNKALSGTLERLSSGRRINHAQDDAAGLAISDKMKAQIRGLSQASRNIMDGISFIQTTEGALAEMHSMLQRMRELAVQAANGSITNDDRGKIQQEITQLTEAIDVIARDTEYNTKKMLAGSRMQSGNGSTEMGNTFIFREKRVPTEASAPGVAAYSYPSSNAVSLDFDAPPAIMPDVGDIIVVGDKTYEFTDTPLAADPRHIPVNIHTSICAANTTARVGELEKAINKNPPSGVSVPISRVGNKLNITGESSSDIASHPRITLSFVGIPSVGDSLSIGGTRYVFKDADFPVNPPDVGVEMPAPADLEGVVAALDAAVNANPPGSLPATVSFRNTLSGISGNQYEFSILFEHNTAGVELDKVEVRASSSKMYATIQTGANGSQYVTMEISKLGTGELGVDGAPALFSTAEGAGTAISLYESAVSMVSTERARLGAYQNRMEHTMNSAGIAEQNLTASLSRIEDTDMALEMSNYTKYNILVQSGTAMLAQANQIPQSVLQLLG